MAGGRYHPDCFASGTAGAARGFSPKHVSSLNQKEPHEGMCRRTRQDRVSPWRSSSPSRTRRRRRRHRPRRRSTSSIRRIPPFPGEAGLDRSARAGHRRRRLQATTDTTAAVSGAEVVLIVVPIVVDARARPDFRAMDAATAAVARGLAARNAGALRDDRARRHDPTAVRRRCWRRASGLACGHGLLPRIQPRAGVLRADLRRPSRLSEARRRHRSRQRRRGRSTFYESALAVRQNAPTSTDRTASGTSVRAEAAELAKLAETTYRDINIAFANELARFSDSAGSTSQR